MSEAELRPDVSTVAEALPPVQSPEPVPSPQFDAPSATHTSDPGGERKLVTVLCCALERSVTGAQRLDLDALYDLIETLFDMVERVARPYGGSLQPTTGEHLVAIFGAPVTHEDHAQRATLAALELHRQLLATPHLLQTPSGETLALRIGLCTGLVVVRGGGGATAEVVSVIGEAVSQAVFLCEQASPGAIFCNEGTARLIQNIAWVDALAAVGAAAERVYQVRRLESASADARRYGDRMLTDFVNRERELEQLLELVAEVDIGRGHAVGVVGEPGIGKSRLVHELRRRVADQSFTYLQGHCLSYGMATPYLPVLDLLRQLCDLMSSDPPDIIAAKIHLQVQRSGMPPETWAPYLLSLLGAQGDVGALSGLSPQALRDRTFEALLQVIAAGCAQRLLIIEIEDLHWIDPTSEAFLTVLVDRLPALRMLLICTYRPGYDPPWMRRSYATQIALRRLAPPNSLRIMQSVLAEVALPSTVEQELLTKADGNPFFLEELTLSVTEQASEAAQFTVPETIHAVIAARLDRLPAAEKRLLQVASVLGKDISFELLKALTQLPDADLSQQLSTLQTNEFLYQTQIFPEPVYNFGHALTQDVAYQSLLQRTRRDYHRQVAEMLEAGAAGSVELQPEYLAHHYAEAGLSQPAILYWQRAGQRDVERSANAEAIEHFTKALDLLRAQPETSARTQLEIELQLALGTSFLMIKGHTRHRRSNRRTRGPMNSVSRGATRISTSRLSWGCGVFNSVMATSVPRASWLKCVWHWPTSNKRLSACKKPILCSGSTCIIWVSWSWR